MTLRNLIKESYYYDKNGMLFLGDCTEWMKKFPDKCIDLTVTSPPYDKLRSYEGYSFDFENIAKQLYRITKKGGVVVWVVGDSTIKGSETGSSFKQALYFKEVGFNLHDTMIYMKNNYIPQNCKRYDQQFEYMFVLVKNKINKFNMLTVETKGKGRIPYSKFRQTNGTTKLQHTLQPIKKYKKRGNVWKYTTGYMHSTKDKFAFKHPAMFPEQLAEDHIVSWSNEGDIVFDPMCGAGTTCKMAKKLNRKYIGIDMSEEYLKDICIPRLQLIS